MSRKTELRADLHRRPNIGAVLELQRSLGLREVEAIRGGELGTLARWQREFRERGSVRVISGTKANDRECVWRRSSELWRRCKVPERYWKPGDNVTS